MQQLFSDLLIYALPFPVCFLIVLVMVSKAPKGSEYKNGFNLDPDDVGGKDED